MIYLVDWNDLEERHFQLRRHIGIKLSSGDFLTFIIFLNDKKTITGVEKYSTSLVSGNSHCDSHFKGLFYIVVLRKKFFCAHGFFFFFAVVSPLAIWKNWCAIILPVWYRVPIKQPWLQTAPMKSGSNLVFANKNLSILWRHSPAFQNQLDRNWKAVSCFES